MLVKMLKQTIVGDTIYAADQEYDIANDLADYFDDNALAKIVSFGDNDSPSAIIRPVIEYAWANRPDATLNQGVVIRITDIGHANAGSRWISDGTYWVPESGRVMLGAGSISVACTGTAGAMEPLATISVPAGAMGTNGRIIISSSFNLTGNNASKEIRHNFGALQLFGATEAANANPRSARFESQIQNRNNTAAQVSSTAVNSAAFASFVGVALLTGTVNTASAVSLTIQGSRGNAGDTTTLEQYTVELIVP